MNGPVKFGIALLVIFLVAVGASRGSSWGPSGCPTVVGPVSSASQAVERQGWVHIQGNTWAWYSLGRQYGWYDADKQLYQDYNPDTGRFGPPYRPKWAAPRVQAPRSGQSAYVSVSESVTEGPPSGYQRVAEVPIPNYGVDTERLADPYPVYTVSGQPVTRDQAIQAVSTIPDDSKLWHLTVIGPPESWKAVQADLASEPRLAAKLVTQFYRPTDWPVDRFGLKDLRQFTESGFYLAVQRDDGAVVHGQFDYQAGDVLLVSDQFDPIRVPDRRRPQPGPTPSPGSPVDLVTLFKYFKEWVLANQRTALALMVGAAFFILQRRKTT